MLNAPKLAEALVSIPGVPYEGVLTRFVDYAAFEAGGGNFLYDQGPRDNGQRYTPKGGALGLYAGEGMKVAQAEASQRGLAGLHPDRADTRLQLDAEIKLRSMLDLGDVSVRRKLKTSLNELRLPWKGGLIEPSEWSATWRLGQAVFDSMRFDGIRYPSAQLNRHYCLLVLSERLGAGSYGKVMVGGDVRQILKGSFKLKA